MKFILPTGIGDSVWALHKIQAIRDKQNPGGRIDVYLVGGNNQIDTRAVDFVQRFSFVDHVEMRSYSIHKSGYWIKDDGTYNYLEDGIYTFDGEKYCVLVPNATLEHGIRLEEWLPHYPIRWDIWKDFYISEEERSYARSFHAKTGDYAVFYPGPLNGNTENGHNRNALWRPEDWAELGAKVQSEMGLKVAVVGAPYDATYWQFLLGPLVRSEGWHNLIGQTSLGQLWGITSRAKFVISYQAGVGIVSTYLGTPTALFWRSYGDSISPDHFLSFDERMASAWVPPKILDAGTHLPLIYGRHGIPYIMAWAKRWVQKSVLTAAKNSPTVTKLG
jgi:ADP-heptose:LPS heptosyltransferase